MGEHFRWESTFDFRYAKLHVFDHFYHGAQDSRDISSGEHQTMLSGSKHSLQFVTEKNVIQGNLVDE